MIYGYRRINGYRFCFRKQTLIGKKEKSFPFIQCEWSIVWGITVTCEVHLSSAIRMLSMMTSHDLTRIITPFLEEGYNLDIKETSSVSEMLNWLHRKPGMWTDIILNELGKKWLDLKKKWRDAVFRKSTLHLFESNRHTAGSWSFYRYVVDSLRIFKWLLSCQSHGDIRRVCVGSAWSYLPLGPSLCGVSCNPGQWGWQPGGPCWWVRASPIDGSAWGRSRAWGSHPSSSSAPPGTVSSGSF